MRVIYLFVLGLLAGCTPLTVYDNPGVAVSRLAQDLQSCAAQSLAAAPQVLTTELRARRVIDYDTVCIDGKCQQVPDFDTVFETVTVDRNATLREELRLQCMVGRGYGIAQLPRCAESDDVRLTPQSPQSAITETSCALPIRGVGPVIYDGG